MIASTWAPAVPCQSVRGSSAGAVSLSTTYRLSAADDRLLEEATRRAFLYFWEQSDPSTGLTLDRARVDGSPNDESHTNVASIAATGFALSALAVGAERRWISEADARARVRATLRFFAKRAAHEHGWFYHWMDAKTGARRWNSEVSSIDTALLLAGVLTVRQRFRDAVIVRLATAIYDRVDFRWMLAGNPVLLSHGWTPENGFLRNRWDHYCELMILYALAIGSRTSPISPKSWYAWARPKTSYAGRTYVNTAGDPIFVHQYAHAWIDFRGRRERQPSSVDWFANSVEATRAHRQFCIDLAPRFPSYSANVWGISASDGPDGYVVWGGPPMDAKIDGTVVPYAVGGSLMFAPDVAMPALRELHDRFGDRIFGRYGFVDAFNPTSGWVDADYIGIDVGITILSAENLRSGAVWRWFMANPEIRRALDRSGVVSRARRLGRPAGRA